VRRLEVLVRRLREQRHETELHDRVARHRGAPLRDERPRRAVERVADGARASRRASRHGAAKCGDDRPRMATRKVRVATLTRDARCETRDDGAVTFTLDAGARATALRAVWTQGDATEDDGTTLVVRDGDARVRVRRRATATAVREGTYVCVRGEPARGSDGEVELANATVAAAEDAGRREAWSDECAEAWRAIERLEG